MVAVVRFDDWSAGHAGDVDRSRAKKGQWFGRDAMIYLDGLVGPRPPLRPLALSPAPSIATAPVDAALWESGGGAVVLVDQTVYKIVSPLADLVTARTVTSAAVGATGYGLAVDTPPVGTNPRAVVTRNNASGVRLVDMVAMTSSDVATATVPSEIVVRWNERFVYATGNTIYYSGSPDSPTDLTAWPSTNNYIVGDGAPITALIPSPLALYVAKASGWWVITGVLGSTATIRQVVERQGVEPAGSAANQGGTRIVAAWDRGMLWLRRRYQAAAPDAQGIEPPYAQVSELRTFTGAVMGDVAEVYATNLARLVGLPVGGALVDQVDRGPDTAVRVSLLDNLVLAHRTAAGTLALTAWRYRTSRPGYGSDTDKTTGDNGAHANVIGYFSPPDWWSTDARQVRVATVYVLGRVYDTSGAGTTATISTARVRCRAVMLGVENTSEIASTQQSWSQVVTLGTGDHDQAMRFDVADAGSGLGFRIELELENVAVRQVYVALEEAAPIR
jgi:hypothetical protein